MTVAELIDELKEFPQDAIITNEENEDVVDVEIRNGDEISPSGYTKLYRTVIIRVTQS